MSFDDIINRKGSYCTQWDYIEDRFGEGTKDIIPFSISDTDFRCPNEILEALSVRLKHGIFGYSRWNHSDYKNSIKNWYTKRFKTEIDPEWIVYGPSVIYCISVLLENLIGKNGKVMTHTPRYDGFSKILSYYDIFEVKLEENQNGQYETDFQKIEQGFKEGVKAFLLCNPENPSGKIWKEWELKKIIDLCNRYDVMLISDDIHMDIVRDKFTPVLKLDTKNSIIVSASSKTFNTPSLGGAYLLIPNLEVRESFINHLKNRDSLSSPTILGVIATIEGYNRCEKWVDELNSYLTKNCEYVVKELDGYRGLKVRIPEATYLMWIDVKGTGMEIETLKKLFVEKGNIGILSGENYGDPFKFRFNVGGPFEKIKLGVEGIKKALKDI